MRIISQNGRYDIPYERAVLRVYQKEYSSKYLILADVNHETYEMAELLDEEEAKAKLLEIARGWRRNFNIFYLGDKE